MNSDDGICERLSDQRSGSVGKVELQRGAEENDGCRVGSVCLSDLSMGLGQFFFLSFHLKLFLGREESGINECLGFVSF